MSNDWRINMQHLACIMSGNRRWAAKRGIPFGQQEGVKSIRRAISFCIKRSIKYLSLYTFSLENFRRPEDQKQFIFDLLVEQTKKQIPELKKEGIRIRFLGDRSLFPASVVKSCEYAEKETAAGNKLQVNLLFCYGARQELVAGIKKIITDVKQGDLKEDAIDQDTISNYLWTSGVPDPDLLFRPDGDHRLSNFLLYQSAYTELYFSDCLWPEVNEHHLQKAYNYFYSCQRNFGK